MAEAVDEGTEAGEVDSVRARRGLGLEYDDDYGWEET